MENLRKGVVELNLKLRGDGGEKVIEASYMSFNTLDHAWVVMKLFLENLESATHVSPSKNEDKLNGRSFTNSFVDSNSVWDIDFSALYITRPWSINYHDLFLPHASLELNYNGSDISSNGHCIWASDNLS